MPWPIPQRLLPLGVVQGDFLLNVSEYLSGKRDVGNQMVNVDKCAIRVILHHGIGWLAVVAHHILRVLEQEEGAEEADGAIAATQDEAVASGHEPVIIFNFCLFI